jgi:nuclear cap-binding protein subunit 2
VRKTTSHILANIVKTVTFITQYSTVMMMDHQESPNRADAEPMHGSDNNSSFEFDATQGQSATARTRMIATSKTSVRHRVLLPPPPRAADLITVPSYQRLYWDRSHYASLADQKRALCQSSTLYVGNLAFRTVSRHVRAHFKQVGPIARVIMGVDRVKKTPCGFCFVEYLYRADALAAVAQLSGTKLDGRIIRVELDAGFQSGRENGRGASGGQVRDDRRKIANIVDPDRNIVVESNSGEGDRDSDKKRGRDETMSGDLAASRGQQSREDGDKNERHRDESLPQNAGDEDMERDAKRSRM